MSLALTLREHFHNSRADLFIRLLEPQPGMTLLDLGGGDGSFARRLCERVGLEVTIAEVHDGHRMAIEAQGFRFVRLSDNDDRLPFRDREFDIVLANSVIEHVTLPKHRCLVSERVDKDEWRRAARTAQGRFAAEVQRIGRGYFVQTPHKHFPIDQHVHLPLVQYLSHNAACRLVSWTDRFWIKSCHGVVDWELFTTREIRRLFPDASVQVERLLGLPKSVIVYHAAE